MQNDVSMLRPEAVQAQRGCQKTQLYKDVNDGFLPPPIKKGRRFTYWPSYEIDAIARAEIGGASKEEIRTLVKQLVEQRSKLRPTAAA
jgi:prophage regulatory protein